MTSLCVICDQLTGEVDMVSVNNQTRRGSNWARGGGVSARALLLLTLELIVERGGWRIYSSLFIIVTFLKNIKAANGKILRIFP